MTFDFRKTIIYLLFLFFTIFQSAAHSSDHEQESATNELTPRLRRTSSSNLIDKDQEQTTGPLALKPWKEPTWEKLAILGFDYTMVGRTIYVSMQTMNYAQLLALGVLGIVAADATSGGFHGLGDELTSDELTDGQLTTENRSLASRMFTAIKMNLFRGSHMHHEKPHLLAKMSYYEKVRGYHILLVPILVASNLYLDPYSQLAVAVFGTVMGNCEVFHTIAHTKCSKPIEALKSSGLILSKERHNVHHYGDGTRNMPPFKYNFCLINGIMDGTVNRVFNFFRSWCGKKAKDLEEDE